MNPVLKPTPQVLAACDHCDKLIGAYLGGVKSRPQSFGRYESEVEYFTLMKLMLRHFESILALAREDLVLAPSATVIARVLFETSIKARWMLTPIDPFEREGRWIQFFQSGIVQAEKLKKSEHTPPQVVELLNKKHMDYVYFYDAIKDALLSRGYTTGKSIPKVKEMLEELAEPHLYDDYIYLSAYTHSNYEAAILYKKYLGETKQIGEFTSMSDWVMPIDIAYKAFYYAAKVFLQLVEADMNLFEANSNTNNHHDVIMAMIRA